MHYAASYYLPVEARDLVEWLRRYVPAGAEVPTRSEVVAVAIRIAAEVVSHVIGEAIGRRQRCAQDAHARADMARAVVASAMPPEAVLAALSEDERARLEARARAAVPPGVSEATAAALLPGIMAGLAEEG